MHVPSDGSPGSRGSKRMGCIEAQRGQLRCVASMSYAPQGMCLGRIRGRVNIFAMASTALRGALWMLGAVLCFLVMAVSVRELLARMEPFEVLFWRVAAALLLTLLFLPRTGLAALRTSRIGLHFTRNAFHFFAQLAWI